MGLFGRKKEVRALSYSREEKTPVIRCSICNGEQVGGLKNKATGEFEEVMLIRDGHDLEVFQRMVGEQEIPKEY